MVRCPLCMQRLYLLDLSARFPFWSSSFLYYTLDIYVSSPPRRPKREVEVTRSRSVGPKKRLGPPDWILPQGARVLIDGMTFTYTFTGVLQWADDNLVCGDVCHRFSDRRICLSPGYVQSATYECIWGICSPHLYTFIVHVSVLWTALQSHLSFDRSRIVLHWGFFGVVQSRFHHFRFSYTMRSLSTLLQWQYPHC